MRGTQMRGTQMSEILSSAVALLLLFCASSEARSPVRPTVLVVVTEKVMGVFDTTGFEQPGHVQALLATARDQHGLAVLDLDTVQRKISGAKARQLLEGDEITAREVALQEEAEYLLIGSATSKPAGTRLFGTNLQSLQANVTLRLLRGDDGRVMGAASAQGSQAHLDEIAGGMLALTEATESVLEALSPVLQGLARPGAAPESLTVQVKGLVSFRHLDFLMAFFQNDLVGVDDARLRDFQGGIAQIGLATAAGAESIARGAVEARFTGFRLRVTRVTPSRIEMEAVLEERAEPRREE